MYILFCWAILLHLSSQSPHPLCQVTIPQGFLISSNLNLSILYPHVQKMTSLHILTIKEKETSTPGLECSVHKPLKDKLLSFIQLTAQLDHLREGFPDQSICLFPSLLSITLAFPNWWLSQSNAYSFLWLSSTVRGTIRRQGGVFVWHTTHPKS